MTLVGSTIPVLWNLLLKDCQMPAQLLLISVVRSQHGMQAP